MNTVFLICGIMLSAAGFLSLYRIVVGPTNLNRTASVDLLVAILIAALGIYSAMNRTVTALPILVVLSLLGFLSSVSVARFVAKDDKRDAP